MGPFLELYQFFSLGLEIASSLFIQSLVAPPLQKTLGFDFLWGRQWRIGSSAKFLLVLLLRLPTGVRSPTAIRALEEEIA